MARREYSKETLPNGFYINRRTLAIQRHGNRPRGRVLAEETETSARDEDLIETYMEVEETEEDEDQAALESRRLELPRETKTEEEPESDVSLSIQMSSFFFLCNLPSVTFFSLTSALMSLRTALNHTTPRSLTILF